MSNILCPIDFSEASINAARYAARLASKFSASLTLLHTEPEYKEVLYEERAGSGLEASVQLRLSELAISLRNEFEVECVFQFEYQEDLVSELAAKMSGAGFGLLVMGTRGSRQLGDLYLGSKTGQVANTIQGVLLSVPDTFDSELPNHVLFAVDEPEESKAHFLEVITFARSFNASITLLHVHHDSGFDFSTEFKTDIERVFGNSDWLQYKSVVHHDVIEAVIEQSEISPGTMIATMSHFKGDHASVFRSSVSKELVEKSKVPTLVFHL